MFHTASGVRVPLQHLWVPKALRRELRGQTQQECFQHMAPAVSSAAALPQDCAPLDLCEGQSCTSSRGIWQLGHHQLNCPHPRLGEVSLLPLLLRMNIPILVTQFGKPMDWFSSVNSPLPKAHVPSLGKHLQLQLQGSRLRGLCVSPVLPYSILPSRKYLERKSNCLETAEIN